MSLESSKIWWDAISYWLTWIGVTLTFFGALASLQFRHVNGLFEAEQADKNRTEKEANDRAIAEANARAAEANLKLEQLKAPRTLSPQQQQAMIDVLKPFAGQKFSMNVFSDAESIALMRTIKAILEAAGWVQIPSQIGVIQIEGAGQMFDDGLIVEIADNAEPKCVELLDILDVEFNAAGIETRMFHDKQLRDITALNIAVGKKP